MIILADAQTEQQGIPRARQSKIHLHPTNDEIRSLFRPHTADQILSYLKPISMEVARTQERYLSIYVVMHNEYAIVVSYIMQKPSGDLGVRTIYFSHYQSVARCLIVTTEGNVLMTREYRATRQSSILNLPGGGDQGTTKETALAEMHDETGAALSANSSMYRIARIWSEDGCLATEIDLVVIDHAISNPHFSNLDENIARIEEIPWEIWHKKALDGDYQDHFCTLFAARCDLDPTTKRVVIRGAFDRL